MSEQSHGARRRTGCEEEDLSGVPGRGEVCGGAGRGGEQFKRVICLGGVVVVESSGGEILGEVRAA